MIMFTNNFHHTADVDECDLFIWLVRGMIILY